MIRDLSFDEIERADRRRRLVRLTALCVFVSTAAAFVTSREMDIRAEYAALPAAVVGDVDSLRARKDAIDSMLDRHHVWTGALAARSESGDLTERIFQEEQAVAAAEKQRTEEEQRIREEIEAARVRGLALAERKRYAESLSQFRRAIELSDSLGRAAWDGGAWPHREQVIADIDALAERVRDGE